MPGWPPGYPSKGPWVFYDVTADFAYWPRLDTLSITQLHPDGLATCTVEVADPAGTLAFEDGDEHYITFRGDRVWAGHVKIANRGDLSAHGPRVWELEGQDYTAKLGDDVIRTAAERPRESLAARVAWILTFLSYPVTTTNVNLPDGTVEPAVYEGLSVLDALQQVSDELALHFYVDFDKDLHMFRTEAIAADFDLDDVAPDYATTFPYSDHVHRTDRTQQTNAVLVKGRRYVRWVLDDASIATYGRLESSIVDDTLITVAQVIAAGQRRLNQLAEPIVDGRLTCWEPGMFAGRVFDIVSEQWPDIDGEYIVTHAEITAPDSHDESGDALMRTDIEYTDRRRVGRFPGSGKDEDDSPPRGGTGGSDLGGCCNPVPVGEEPVTEAEQEFEPVAMVPTASFITPPVVYETGDRVIIYRAVVSPPPGTFTGAHIVTNPTMSGIQTHTSGRRRLFVDVRDIDGSEPAQWEIELTGSTPDAEGWIWHVVKPPIVTVHNETSAANSDVASLGGDDLALGYTDTHVTVQVLTMYESIDDEGYVSEVASENDPAGTTRVGSIRVDGGGDHGEIWMAVAHGQVSSDDPATFGDWIFELPNAGFISCHVFRVGDPYTGPGYETPLPPVITITMTIPPGPTWEGGNVGVNQSTDQVDATVAAGVLVLSSDETGKDFVMSFSGPPDLPTQLDDFTITVPFELDVAGDLTDADERYFGYIVTIDGQRVGFYARLGDAVRAQGVLIEGAADHFVAKDITEGALHYLKFRLSAGVAYVKMWEDGDPEPDWDATTDELEATTDPDSLVLDVMLGNDGAPAQTLELHPTLISGGALPGESVDWEVVGLGDGTTVTFETSYPYDELSLQVRVDQQQLLGSAITAMDGAAGTFTLSRAPYGDPADPTGSSVVEARYVRS